jgi:TRAP-type C4-dicarboxylate transport system permease small subunit
MTHNAIMLIASGYAAAQSLAFVERMATMGQTSMGLGVPMLVPHSALVVGFAGTATVSSLLLIGDILALRRQHDGKVAQ